MRLLTSKDETALIDLLSNGAVGVMLTDTIYGIVAPANDSKAVERVYNIRNRDFDKPCIVLIGNLNQIWDMPNSDELVKTMNRYWPGPVSLILPVTNKTPRHISRGGNSVAFRLPDNERLARILDRTGPIIAPSANPAGLPPAATIEEAMAYFGDKLDFYTDEGPAINKNPSQLLKIEEDGKTTRLR